MIIKTIRTALLIILIFYPDAGILNIATGNANPLPPPADRGRVSSEFRPGVQPGLFERMNLSTDHRTGSVYLDTRPVNGNLLLPFNQKVAVTFVFEGSDHKNVEFGWLNASEGPHGYRQIIYSTLNDDLPRNGVLDILERDQNQDGRISVRDNTAVLGPFPRGSELVFYLDTRPSGAETMPGGLFFTQNDWNETQSVCEPGIRKTLLFNQPARPGPAGCGTYETGCDRMADPNGWLEEVVLTRLKDAFGLTFGCQNPFQKGLPNIQCMDQPYRAHAAHTVIRPPQGGPFSLVLGFEDSRLDRKHPENDHDYNDFVFLVEHKNGGAIQLKPSHFLIPDTDLDHAFYTGAELVVHEYVRGCRARQKEDIRYFISADGGKNWIEIDSWDHEAMDARLETDGDLPVNDDVQYRAKTRRIDLTDMNMTGRRLTWKAELISPDGSCIPGISRVGLTGYYMTHGYLSRSSAVIKANLLYTAGCETPSRDWALQTGRGHLTAERVYNPMNPDQTAEADRKIWDAGEALDRIKPGDRNILIPEITVKKVKDALLCDLNGHPLLGDGRRTEFSGRLGNSRIMAGTLKIFDDRETFYQQGVNELRGDYTGYGRIDHYSGHWAVTFHKPPAMNVPLRAGYSHYRVSNDLMPFDSANVSSDMLGLTPNHNESNQYADDMNQDFKIDDQDVEWVVQWVRGYESPDKRIEKEWKLGSIVHSTPAVLTPPGVPSWYADAMVPAELKMSHGLFMENLKDRATVVFVGSKDGLLHALDGGRFRQGDNPATQSQAEKRGYFQWTKDGIPCSGPGPDCRPDYGTGTELWAFIPPNLLPGLKHQVAGRADQARLDASPVLADVHIHSTWKTILLMTQGNGGDFMFCLDVTDPAAPQLLWEFGSPDLLRTHSLPSVPAVGRTWDKRTGNEIWLAYVSSGDSNYDHAYPRIYLVDISTGALYDGVGLDAGVDLNGDGALDDKEKEYGRGSVPVSYPILVDSDLNGYIDRVYVATSKGVLYKINIPDHASMAGQGITHCVINEDFTDARHVEIPQDGRWQPIHAAPLVMVENHGSDPNKSNPVVKIFFGTGLIGPGDPVPHSGYFYSYLDMDSKGQCLSSHHVLEWYMELENGLGVLNPAFEAGGNIYIVASKTKNPHAFPPSDPDDPGESQVYVAQKNGELIHQDKTQAVVTGPVVEDEHLYLRTVEGVKSYGKGVYNNDIKRIGVPKIRILHVREITDQFE